MDKQIDNDEDKVAHVLNDWVRMLLAGIDLPNEPRRDKVGEADRPEHELGIAELRLVSQLSRIQLVLLSLFLSQY